MSLPGERMTELEGRDASAAEQIQPISHPQPCHIYATRFGWQKGWPRSSTGFPLTLASHCISEKIFGVGKKTSDYINVRGTKSFNQLYPLLTITQATLKISNCKISICMTHWGKCKLRDYLGFVSNMHRMPSVSTLKKETMARSGSCASRN